MLPVQTCSSVHPEREARPCCPEASKPASLSFPQPVAEAEEDFEAQTPGAQREKSMLIVQDQPSTSAELFGGVVLGINAVVMLSF